MKNKSRAFTLIELLVVVLIIGILAAIAVPQYQVAVGKARYMQLIALGDAVQKAEEVYYLANNEYTNDLTKLDLDLSKPPSHVSMSIVSTKDAVVLSSSSGLSAEYVVFFNHNSSKSYRGRRECRAYDSAAKKLCASVTGNNTEYPDTSYSFWVF